MKIKILLLLGAIAGSMVSSAQEPAGSLLKQIENNNTTLAALKKQVEAQKAGNKSGIYPTNPEVEFNYLWGSPSTIGNRTDVSIRQSFDFPSAYGYRNRISELKNQQADLEYRKQRQEILSEALNEYTRWVYYSTLKKELGKRTGDARLLADALKSRFDSGDANIIDYNKARLFLLDAEKEAETNEINLSAAKAGLERLNGGKTFELPDSGYPEFQLPADFNDWYGKAEENNPVLLWLKKELEIGGKQVQLNSALSLPKFSAGYMSEKVVGEHFQGITMGISVPLWENKNSVKQAKAHELAMQSLEADSKLQFYNQLKIEHTKAVSLQNSVSGYRKGLETFSNAEYLEAAFAKGNISLSEYILELTVYYQSIDKLLEAEKEFYLALSSLNRYTL